MKKLWKILLGKIQEYAATLAVALLAAVGVATWGWARTFVIVEMPIGAVVAFDLADGCPKDGKWIAFDDANGRTIVGAVRSASLSDLGDDGQPIATHKYHDRAGGEWTTLSVQNLPPFTVPLFYTTTNDQGDKPAAMVRGISANSGNNSVQLQAGGTSQRFSREMPNLALFFCKKTS